MNYKILLVVLIGIGLVEGTIWLVEGTEDKLPEDRIFDIESGKIEFEFVNGLQYGTKTYVFADWGKSEKVITKVEVDTSLASKFKVPEQYYPESGYYLQIRHNGRKYLVDLREKKGRELEIFNLDLPKREHDTSVKDVFMDRECTVITEEGIVKFWDWKGIALKKESPDSSYGTRQLEYAIEIQEDYEIKVDEFEIPADIEIVE